MAEIVIVSHVSLYREGLARILAQESDMTVCGQADCLSRAVDVLKRVTADVVLVDLASAHSLGDVRSLSALFPDARFLALGIEEDPSAVVDYAEAGISSYVNRHASAEQLIETIRGTSCGELQCSPRVAAALMERVATLAALGSQKRSKPCLTNRELEIVTMVEQGLTNKQIARELSIATATVRNHVHNILEKLGARTRGEAAATVRRSMSL